ncbi:MAG: alanine racemase, partial [Candidatus Dormibacteraeota bacterium]|nr:alanine racemase [Candidatus Dormibacteraeota bacterium]
VCAAPGLRLAGFYSHFAAAESDPAFTREQFGLFSRVAADLGVDPGLRHMANSAAALRHPEMALDAVRCGIALYGCEDDGLRPALSLSAPITQVTDVAPGATVGYGRTWRAGRPSRVATVGIGYEDGVLRRRSGRGYVLISGHRAPVVGSVSMDQLTVDATDVPGVAPGMRATLIGEGLRAEEVAAWSETISYEVLTALGRRVERAYRNT